MAQASTYLNIEALEAEELAAADAHAALPVEPATPPPGIELAATFEQMQATMKQLEQENKRFELFFAGDQSEAQSPEYCMTPQKATAAILQAEIPTPWAHGWGDPWRTSTDVCTSYKSSSSPKLTPKNGWQQKPWCQPATAAQAGTI